MFIDRAHIRVKGGDGGRGCVSFRREKYVPHGGPDGGDGGRGGDVIIRARAGLGTLLDVTRRSVYKAERGGHGSGSNRHGKRGRDLVVEVPPGTAIRDYHYGNLLKDLRHPDDEVIVASGGKGGRGNRSFASANNRAPRTATPGEPGQERELRLELKLIADVGLIGFPNAGKSTLLSRLSQARPRVADYPFTTLAPQLGVIRGSDYRRIVLAEIPGMTEGAHAGVGLGNEFLRHAERTRLLVHLVDVGMQYELSAADRYQVLRKELASYGSSLASKPELVVATKVDLLINDDALREIASSLGRKVLAVSAVTGAGLEEFLQALFARFEQVKESQPELET